MRSFARASRRPLNLALIVAIFYILANTGRSSLVVTTMQNIAIVVACLVVVITQLFTLFTLLAPFEKR